MWWIIRLYSKWKSGKKVGRGDGDYFDSGSNSWEEIM